MIERHVLSNGLVVLGRQDKTLPLACGTLLFRTGSLHEGRHDAGLCSFTMELLLQGTKRLNAYRFSDTLERLGISMTSESSEDYAEIGWMAPAAQGEKTLGLLAQAILDPAFPTSEISKERSRVLAALHSRQDSIFSVAHDKWCVLRYGRHPYGRLADGVPQTVSRFTSAHIRRWHGTYIRPDRAILSLVSPRPVATAIRLVEQHLSGWKRLTKSIQSMSLPPTPLGRSKRAIVHAHFEQAYFMTGTPAPSVFEPEYFDLKVLNILLGGGMSSRLFIQLRERLGLAYEVASFYSTRLQSSEWVIYLGLPATRVQVAQERMERLFETLADRGPSWAEIRQAQQMLRGAYLMEHQTLRRQAWYAAWWEFLGRAPSYDEQYLRLMDAVTPARARQLARSLLSGPRVTVTVLPERQLTKKHGSRSA